MDLEEAGPPPSESSITAPSTGTLNQAPNQRNRYRNSHPRGGRRQAESQGADSSSHQRNPNARGHGRAGGRGRHGSPDSMRAVAEREDSSSATTFEYPPVSASRDDSISSTSRRPARYRHRNIEAGQESLTATGSSTRLGSPTPMTSTTTVDTEDSWRLRNLRAAKFNAGLSEESATVTSSVISAHISSPLQTSQKNFRSNSRGKRSEEEADDLTSRLTHGLRTAPYYDCPICFSSIHPLQPIWSCLPSRTTQSRGEDGACCYTPFHMKCIRPWASKSVKETHDAWLARGETRAGEWRCPGCQKRREEVPTTYLCFCGSTPDPKPARLATPHSCGGPCSRQRVDCGHSCPLLCHPGPCPPCRITIQLSCWCSKQTLSFKCGGQKDSARGMSCGIPCGKDLGCGRHKCIKVCHEGPCGQCGVREEVECYCRRESREVRCGEGIEEECALLGPDGKEEQWIGRFACERLCERPFDCNIHRCTKPCHSPSRIPPPCPFSPTRVRHCPCGKHTLEPTSSAFFPPDSVLVRTKCSDPIPVCTSTCMKPLDGCDHVCSSPCHSGPCPPCSIMIVRPCRCGATTRPVRCPGGSGTEEDVLCDRPCGVLRACGRHQCTRICCPLAGLTSKRKGKGKGRKKAEPLDLQLLEESGLHECDLICGRMLSCGNHRCEERDHSGLCPPCLRSSFEEIVCACRRTILEPPIPCGTVIHCPYPCIRPLHPCGHPKVPHSCHGDSAPCPPCPHLTAKLCACGKKTVPNVRCSQERVSCGMKCEKIMGCGFHHCQRLCHSDDCGQCTAACGKTRRLCLPDHHLCIQPCHAPASCSESEPCTAIISLTCPCGRIQQNAKCGRCNSNSAGRAATQQLKCTDECARAKRNARLAEALGISTEGRKEREKDSVVYSEELQSFARANRKFIELAEKAFADFVSSEKRLQVLPPMPPERRQFIRDLAVIYRMDTQMLDQEPHRSVQLMRRVDTRIPPILLSASIPAPPPVNLGKLADLRAPISQRLHTVHTLTPAVRGPSVGASRPWASASSQPVNRTTQLAVRSITLDDGRQSPAPAVRLVSTPSSQLFDGDVPDSWEDEA